MASYKLPYNKTSAAILLCCSSSLTFKGITMRKANKAKTTTAIEPTVEAVAAAPAANPFATLAQQVTAAPAAAPAVGVKVKAAAVLATLAPDAVNSVGAPVANLAPSIQAKGVSSGKQYASSVLATTYTLGAKLLNGANPARGQHDVPCVALVQSAMEDTGSATGADLYAAGVPWHSLAAYLKRGWVVQE